MSLTIVLIVLIGVWSILGLVWMAGSHELRIELTTFGAYLLMVLCGPAVWVILGIYLLRDLLDFLKPKWVELLKFLRIIER